MPGGGSFSGAMDNARGIAGRIAESGSSVMGSTAIRMSLVVVTCSMRRGSPGIGTASPQQHLRGAAGVRGRSEEAGRSSLHRLQQQDCSWVAIAAGWNPEQKVGPQAKQILAPEVSDTINWPTRQRATSQVVVGERLMTAFSIGRRIFEKRETALSVPGVLPVYGASEESRVRFNTAGSRTLARPDSRVKGVFSRTCAGVSPTCSRGGSCMSC